MVSWRPEERGEKRPEVLGRRNLMIALVFHVVAFVGFYLFAALHGLFKPKETIIPIDLTVVVNENLDGNENEPPPLRNPEPEPPKPKPEPPQPAPKKIEPPKPLEQIVTNVVVKKDAPKKKKKDPPKKKEPPKKKDPPKKVEPKKSAKELREEKLRRIRERGKLTNKPVKTEVKNAPSGNGRTAKKTLSDAEIRKLLNMGYKPGTSEQLATSDLQLGVSLVQMALNEKWEQLNPKVGNSGTVLLSVKFNSNGGLINVRVSQSCGDKQSDDAALSVAKRITSIRGLPPEFLERFRKETLTIRYRVQGK